MCSYRGKTSACQIMRQLFSILYLDVSVSGINVYVDQKCDEVKMESPRTLIKITRLTSKQSYMPIIRPNTHYKLIKLLLFNLIYYYLVTFTFN